MVTNMKSEDNIVVFRTLEELIRCPERGLFGGHTYCMNRYGTYCPYRSKTRDENAPWIPCLFYAKRKKVK